MMIGNITTGKSFGKLINYLFKEGQGAKSIYASSLKQNPSDIAEDFERIANNRPSTLNPVKHIIVSFAPKDGEVSNQLMQDIATKIVKELGYFNNQMLIVKHDRNASHHNWQHNHDHLHIVVNMVTYGGQRVHDQFDKTRLETILRNLELKYNLTPVIKSQDRQLRRPKKNRYQKYQREYQVWQEKLKTNSLAEPPEEPAVQTLETIIKAAAADKPTLSVYLARLQHLGYETEMFTIPKGRHRIKYKLNSGEKISRISGGSLAQLKKLGVSYQPKRDDVNIARSATGTKIPITKTKLLTKDNIERHRYLWLNEAQQKAIAKHRKTKANLEQQSTQAPVGKRESSSSLQR